MLYFVGQELGSVAEADEVILRAIAANDPSG